MQQKAHLPTGGRCLGARIFAAIVLAGAHHSTFAGTTSFQDETAWRAANPGFSFEGFDNQPSGSQGALSKTFTSGLKVTASVSTLWIYGIGFGNSTGGSAPNVLSDNTQGAVLGQPEEFTFEFPKPSLAAGLLIIDHENGSLPEWLDFFGGAAQLYRYQPLPFDNSNGGSATVNTPAFFVGIRTDVAPITSMRIHFDRPGFFGDSVAMDNVQWLVPEPAAGCILMAGAAACLRRRRR